MVTIAQAHCLVDTATLQGSIRKEQHGNIVSVKAGGLQFINPKTHKGVDYAHHVELKNPYMRPAWETVSKFIDKLIHDKVLEKVQK